MDADVPEVESNKCAVKKPFLCLICNKCFPSMSKLKRHMLTHSEDRPFSCNYAQCNKTFKLRYHLEEHEKIHTGEKTHICTICNKDFTQKCHLQKHELIHKGEKSHICPICNKAFVAKWNLQRHELIHKDERPFSCDHAQCNKTFRHRHRLNDHKKTHREVMLYTCPQCEKSFEVYRFYLRHLQIHIIENREMLLTVKKLASRMQESTNYP